MYTAALWFKAAAVAIELFSVCEVLTCLVREIVIRCSNIISEDHVWSITWLMKILTLTIQSIRKILLSANY